MLEVSTNRVSGSGELCVLARLAQGSGLILIPDAGASILFFLFVLVFFEVFGGLAEFILIRCIRIEVDFSLNFVRGSVDVLVF